MNQSSHHTFLSSFTLVYMRRPTLMIDKEHKVQVKVRSHGPLFASGGAEAWTPSMALMAILVNILAKLLSR